jgi:hypothetical protein
VANSARFKIEAVSVGGLPLPNTISRRREWQTISSLPGKVDVDGEFFAALRRDHVDAAVACDAGRFVTCLAALEAETKRSERSLLLLIKRGLWSKIVVSRGA